MHGYLRERKTLWYTSPILLVILALRSGHANFACCFSFIRQVVRPVYTCLSHQTANSVNSNHHTLLWLIAMRSQARPCPLGHWLLLAKHVNGGEKTGNKSTQGESNPSTSMGGLYVAATLQVPLSQSSPGSKKDGFLPSGLKVWNLRGTCLVWVAKQTKQLVPRKPGGVRGTMGGAFISLGNNVFVCRASVVRDCRLELSAFGGRIHECGDLHHIP